MKLIFATHNKGKLIEMREILAGLSVDVLSAEEAGVFEDVIEDGKTFEENAIKKARFVAEKTGEWAVADDSGICIETLGGEPGVYSARWSGGEDLVQFTLSKLKGIPLDKRKAYFESAAVICSPDGRCECFSGVINGRVPLEPKGEPRPKLPYDTIFIPEGFEKTFAEMTDAGKNALSHRGLAFRELRRFVEKTLIAGSRL